MAFKMKMKTYGQGKSPIKFMGVMGAMKGISGAFGKWKKRNQENETANPVDETDEVLENTQKVNPNLQNPIERAQGAISGAVDDDTIINKDR